MRIQRHILRHLRNRSHRITVFHSIKPSQELITVPYRHRKIRYSIPFGNLHRSDRLAALGIERQRKHLLLRIFRILSFPLCIQGHIIKHFLKELHLIAALCCVKPAEELVALTHRCRQFHQALAIFNLLCRNLFAAPGIKRYGMYGLFGILRIGRIFLLPLCVQGHITAHCVDPGHPVAAFCSVKPSQELITFPLRFRQVRNSCALFYLLRFHCRSALCIERQRKRLLIRIRRLRRIFLLLPLRIQRHITSHRINALHRITAFRSIKPTKEGITFSYRCRKLLYRISDLHGLRLYRISALGIKRQGKLRCIPLCVHLHVAGHNGIFRNSFAALGFRKPAKELMILIPGRRLLNIRQLLTTHTHHIHALTQSSTVSIETDNVRAIRHSALIIDPNRAVRIYGKYHTQHLTGFIPEYNQRQSVRFTGRQLTQAIQRLYRHRGICFRISYTKSRTVSVRTHPVQTNLIGGCLIRKGKSSHRQNFIQKTSQIHGTIHRNGIESIINNGSSIFRSVRFTARLFRSGIFRLARRRLRNGNLRIFRSFFTLCQC